MRNGTAIGKLEKVERKLAKTGDSLGKGIDDGIFSTVVSLNLFGFKTEQSCEGHLNRGRPFPWITIAVPGSKDYYRLSASAKNEPTKAWEYRSTAEKKVAKVMGKLDTYLTLFYENRQVDNDVRLIAYTQVLGFITLENSGGFSLLAQNKRMQKQKHAVYLKEFVDFGSFLRNLYLS
jgi:hypothetical protein